MTHKDIIHIYSDLVWNDKNHSELAHYLTEDVVIHSPLKTVSGIPAMKDIINQWLTAFPDLTVTWQDFIADNDKVAVRWEAVGQHHNAFLGYKPTGKTIHYSGVSIYRLLDNKIAEYWGNVDMRCIEQQLKSA